MGFLLVERGWEIYSIAWQPCVQHEGEDIGLLTTLSHPSCCCLDFLWESREPTLVPERTWKYKGIGTPLGKLPSNQRPSEPLVTICATAQTWTGSCCCALASGPIPWTTSQSKLRPSPGLVGSEMPILVPPSLLLIHRPSNGLAGLSEMEKGSCHTIIHSSSLDSNSKTYPVVPTAVCAVPGGLPLESEWARPSSSEGGDRSVADQSPLLCPPAWQVEKAALGVWEEKKLYKKDRFEEDIFL